MMISLGAIAINLCIKLALFHPLGAKLVDKPLKVAQSQQREIAIPKSPETRVREAFLAEWEKIGADKHIFNLGRLARIYGIASIAMPGGRSVIASASNAHHSVDWFDCSRPTQMQPWSSPAGDLKSAPAAPTPIQRHAVVPLLSGAETAVILAMPEWLRPGSAEPGT
jgi:hypothetical protein